MVISLSSDNAYKYFKEEGFVVSARTKKRKRPFCKTWLNRGRGKKKVCDVNVAYITKIYRYTQEGLSTMRNFAPFTGLYHLREWFNEIIELNGLESKKEIPEVLYLYLISQ